jgi:hypothetical protein
MLGQLSAKVQPTAAKWSSTSRRGMAAAMPETAGAISATLGSEHDSPPLGQ